MKINRNFLFKVFFFVLLFSFFNFGFSKERPSSAEISYYKGISYYLLGDINSAKKYVNAYFDAVRKEDLRNAYRYLFENDKLSASRIFEKYIRERYKRLDALLGYALSIGEYSFYYEEYYFSLANDIFSRKSITYLTYGFFYLKEGDLASAKELISKAIRIYDLPEYHLIYSIYYRYSGKQLKELKELKNYLGKTNYKEGYLRVAEILSLQKKYEEAIKFLENCPDFDRKIIMKAKLFRLNGDSEQALSTLKSVKNKDSFAYKKELGINYYLKGKTSKAIKIFKKLEFLAPEDKEYFFYYGKALIKKNAALAGKWLYRAAALGEEHASEEIKDTPRADELINKINKRTIINFFRVDGFKWIDEGEIIVWGKKRANSYQNFVYLLNSKGDIIKTFLLDEIVQNVEISPDKRKVALVTFSKRKDIANFYIINLSNKSIRKVNTYGLDEKVWKPIFSDDSSRVFFVSEDYIKSAFKAPFSIEDNMGKSFYFYPDIILSGYFYSISGGIFAPINRRNIDRNIPLFNDITRVSSFYSNFEKFRNLIEKGKGISISSSSRMLLLTDNDNIVVFEATDTQSFLYHIFKEDGSIIEGDSGKIMKKGSYEYCEPIFFNPDNNMLFIKGEEKIIVVDTLKHKLKKVVRGVGNVRLFKRRLYYTNKDLRVYFIDIDKLKIKKAMKMRGYSQIITDNKYIYFVYKGLWLYSEGRKREVFRGLFPKVEKSDISPLGTMIAFSVNNKLIILPLN